MTTATISERLPAVQQYTKLLLQLDELMLRGKGNSADADEIRQEMEQLWYAMSETERERVGGLSEDLYALAAGGAKSVAMSAAQRREWAHAAPTALLDADTALAFLRRPCPQDLPAYVITFLQSRYWERLGDMEVALRFKRAAECYDPTPALSVLLLRLESNLQATP